jgi:hypothetical protein
MKKTTSLGGLAMGVTALLVGAAFGHPPRKNSTSQENASAKPPVVLELFTSEGCSTCPPADLLLSDLQNKPIVGTADIIAFEEHVAGWTSFHRINGRNGSKTIKGPLAVPPTESIRHSWWLMAIAK